MIESGRAAGAWVDRGRARRRWAALVQTAHDKGVPILVNGTPDDYGFDGPQPGVSFSTIDYEAEGKALGEQLGNCINEKLRRQGRGALRASPPRARPARRSSRRRQGRARGGRARRRDRRDHHRQGPRRGADRHRQRPAGQPRLTAVIGQNDEGALGAIGAFEAAGKSVPCITDFGGNDEVLAAVKAGNIYASVALQFEADMTQSFDTLAR